MLCPSRNGGLYSCQKQTGTPETQEGLQFDASLKRSYIFTKTTISIRLKYFDTWTSYSKFSGNMLNKSSICWTFSYDISRLYQQSYFFFIVVDYFSSSSYLLFLCFHIILSIQTRLYISLNVTLSTPSTSTRTQFPILTHITYTC